MMQCHCDRGRPPSRTLSTDDGFFEQHPLVGEASKPRANDLFELFAVVGNAAPEPPTCERGR